MSNVYYWSQGETPTLSGVLQREVDDDVWEDEDLTGTTVTVSLYRMNGSAYKTAAVTVVSGGRVKYTGVAADTQQGELSGKFSVTYADGSVIKFPKPGRFQIRVSQ